jgi:hypothetical protein
MKLEALRAEDEIKWQQKANSIQWTMSDLPPRAVSRDALPPSQAFQCPPPESVSKWGEEVSVHFEDVSGTQGRNQRVGYSQPEMETDGIEQRQKPSGSRCKLLTHVETSKGRKMFI